MNPRRGGERKDHGEGEAIVQDFALRGEWLWGWEPGPFKAGMKKYETSAPSFLVQDTDQVQWLSITENPNAPCSYIRREVLSDVIIHDRDFSCAQISWGLSAQLSARLNGGRSYGKLKFSEKLGSWGERLKGPLLRTRDMTMTTIVLNGEDFQCDANSTISDLLKRLDLHPKGVAVEHNKKIIKKGDYSKTMLRSGDRVEIVHFVGGG